jgi:predicted regulator of Ras-like GTPase activity (Roadblock/LC7/MglB family)
MDTKMKDSAIVDVLLRLDKKVRSVAVMSDDLEVSVLKMQTGTAPYSPPFIDEVVVPIIAGMLKRLTEYAGEFELCRISYKKVRLVMYKLHDGFLVVSAEPTVDLDSLCDSIARLA